jgi:hypothetical protein
MVQVLSRVRWLSSCVISQCLRCERLCTSAASQRGKLTWNRTFPSVSKMISLNLLLSEDLHRIKKPVSTVSCGTSRLKNLDSCRSTRSSRGKPHCSLRTLGSVLIAPPRQICCATSSVDRAIYAVQSANTASHTYVWTTTFIRLIDAERTCTVVPRLEWESRAYLSSLQRCDSSGPWTARPGSRTPPLRLRSLP